jgi:hypothetical protein
VHVSIASPSHAAFPKLWAGRHPHCPFRGLLRLHSRYGPHACSTAQGGLLSRGFDGTSCPATPPVSYQLNRQLAGRNPPPQVLRAFEAHQSQRTYRHFPTKPRNSSIQRTAPRRAADIVNCAGSTAKRPRPVDIHRSAIMEFAR